MVIEGVEKIKKSTLTEGVIDRIKELIESTHIKSGAKFPTERELAEMFGVGRSSVREALRVLQAMGALDRKQGIGTYLNNGAIQSLKRFEINTEKYTFLELVEARKIIEVQTAELAAKKATAPDIQIMKTSCEKHEAAIRSKLSSEITVLDYNFHWAVAMGAHNSFLIKMFEILHDNLISFNYAVLTKGKAVEAISYHRQILKAIKAHDPEEAKTIMQQHLFQVEKDIIQSYGYDEEGNDDRTRTADKRVKA